MYSQFIFWVHLPSHIVGCLGEKEIDFDWCQIMYPFFILTVVPNMVYFHLMLKTLSGGNCSEFRDMWLWLMFQSCQVTEAGHLATVCCRWYFSMVVWIGEEYLDLDDSSVTVEGNIEEAKSLTDIRSNRLWRGKTLTEQFQRALEVIMYTSGETLPVSGSFSVP